MLNQSKSSMAGSVKEIDLAIVIAPVINKRMIELKPPKIERIKEKRG